MSNTQTQAVSAIDALAVNATGASIAASGDHEYFAQTQEVISLGRDPMTSLVTEPPHTFDIVWNMDLHTLLSTAEVKPPRQVDAGEFYHAPGTVDSTKFKYTLSTNALTAVIECKKEFATATYTITYSQLSPVLSVTGAASTEIAALAILAKKMSTDGATATIIATSDLDLSRDVGSSIAPFVIVAVSSSVQSSLSDGTQNTQLAAVMTALKTSTGTSNWYSLTATTFNRKSVTTQVREGLAQLFDRDPQLNNLIGSAATSSTFLDASKIQAKLQSSTDDFYTKFFSVTQLKEVLEAVADKGSRVTVGATFNTWAFVAGDSISCVLRVIDTDSSNTATSQNSERWLITLQHVV